MKVNVFKTDGTDAGKKVDLSDDIYGIEPNDHVLYEDIRSIQGNKRQGTAKTKNRNEVRGGGRKAYRQKGTGNARRGTIRSPLLIGGGTVFGPQPRNYSVRLNKKMRQLARKSALSYKASEEAIKVVENVVFETPRTKEIKQLLAALKSADKKVLVLTGEKDSNVYLSGRNIQKVHVLSAQNLNTYDIMNAEELILTESAVETVKNLFNTEKVEA